MIHILVDIKKNSESKNITPENFYHHKDTRAFSKEALHLIIHR
jgi:hypothetical protein